MTTTMHTTTSEDTVDVFKALIDLQAELPTVPRGKTATVRTRGGDSYSYSYADLADVAHVAMPLLVKHQLGFVCAPRQTEHGYELAGRIIHVSGQWVEGALRLSGNTPQEIGSSLTYARRYLLGALTGIVTDDDDDGALSQAAAERQNAENQAKLQVAQAWAKYRGPFDRDQAEGHYRSWTNGKELAAAGVEELTAYAAYLAGTSPQQEQEAGK